MALTGELMSLTFDSTARRPPRRCVTPSRLAFRSFVYPVGRLTWMVGLLAGSGALAVAQAQAVAPDHHQARVQTDTMDPLDFSHLVPIAASTQVEGRTIAFRAYEDVVYVRHPLDATYQRMNIYVPEAYFHGRQVNGYSADTAPIFFPNPVGGYMPARPGVPGKGGFGPPPAGGSRADAMQMALAHGMVVASPGARGRTQATGKAPAAIVDLKAAVRYLKYNDRVMPGDARRIISNGTSAGGALSVLLGASANQPDYAPYLRALGAADAPDDIYAVSAYCPISILGQADAAYEWEFNGVDAYEKLDISQVDFHVQRKLVKGVLTSAEKAVSADLKPQFASYVNSLGLRGPDGLMLSLDARGNGSFKAHVASYLAASAQQQLDAGKDLAGRDWLTIHNGKVVAVDFDRFARAIGRQKVPPAFDGLSLENAENEEFGNGEKERRHFTEYSSRHSAVQGAGTADEEVIRMMDPMSYIARGQAGPQHWRIRVGTADRDTSHAIAVILATRLQNSGRQVDMAMPWDVPHSGDYDLDALFGWIEAAVAADGAAAGAASAMPAPEATVPPTARQQMTSAPEGQASRRRQD